ncbi:hypothetical protein RHGRI_025634 [Rhododendron griersonianum]|uniref:Uncharacterized protein n=1 Tax=Rhododendron griersonianum TaxID=479676 RepID=A0AAV6IR36_9ERIC|nr:hypothetical protein RHGRI_025634 [Rhododendron griersonianum]
MEKANGAVLGPQSCSQAILHRNCQSLARDVFCYPNQRAGERPESESKTRGYVMINDLRPYDRDWTIKVVVLRRGSETIILTLWGDLAKIEGDKLKTSAYGGLLSISTLSITTLQVKPKIPEADTIRQWYNENGTESSSSAMVWETDKQSVRVTIEDLIELPLPDFESPFCYFKAAIILIHNIDQSWYDACKVCNKKIYNTEQGIECSKCAKSNPEHHPSCVPLYDFSYIYNYLMASPRSLVDSFCDKKEGCYNPKMSPVIPRNKW